MHNWERIIAVLAQDPEMKSKWLAFRGGVLVAVGTSYRDVKSKVNGAWKPTEIRIRRVSRNPLVQLVLAYKPRRVRS